MLKLKISKNMILGVKKKLGENKGQVLAGSNRFRQVLAGSDRFGQVFADLGRFRQVFADLDRFLQVLTCFVQVWQVWVFSRRKNFGGSI